MHAYVCVFVCVYIYRDMEREDGGRHFFLIFSPFFPPPQRQRGGGLERGGYIRRTSPSSWRGAQPQTPRKTLFFFEAATLPSVLVHSY
jgi:hypothetical protein